MAHKTFRNGRGVQGSVPDVGDIAGEQAPSGSPEALVDLSRGTNGRIQGGPWGLPSGNELGKWTIMKKIFARDM
jgi:hypothetical protein